MRAPVAAAVFVLAAIAGISASSDQLERSWECRVLPAEREITVDDLSGVRVVFVTTHEASDRNLYFHQRSCLPDGSMLVFVSERTGRAEPFGYVEATGELVRLGHAADPRCTGFTVSRYTNNVYLVKAGAVYDWAVELVPGRVGERTKVTVRERRICALPKGIRLKSGLNENADGRYLSFGFQRSDDDMNEIVAIEKATGKIITVTKVPWNVSHVQFSWTDPEMVMFARSYEGGDRAPLTNTEDRHCRFWFADFSDRPAWPGYWQRPGELVTHECWWVNGLVTFCGAQRDEESHVKIFDPQTGVVRIVGAGSWWAGGTPFELSKRNWWHAAGDPGGKWVAADNWHGDIVVFDAKTTEERLVTQGHRTYGGGAHPHVGWAPSGERVVFTSNRKGNADVCVAIIPENWQNER
jgi:hypothetical protein